jgi:phosphohistidine phosphatase
MKRLFLVRHAKSSWTQPGLSDHARPLADRGVRDSKRTFSRLLDHGPRLDLVVTSDAKRALATTQHLAQILGLTAAQVSEEQRLYHASAAKILAIAREQPDQHTTIACVGHNPGFTDAVNALVDDLDLDNLPTCGVVGMEFAIDHWTDLSAGGARLIYLDYPKNAGHPILHA